MDYAAGVDPFKATFLVSEVIQNNVLKRRGIACAVCFKGKIFLVTSSSAVEAKDHSKKLVLIAERFSRKHFHDYRLEVSLLAKRGNFTFLKIDKEHEFGKVGRSWVMSLNLELPSSERKASENQFRGMEDFELQFKRNGNCTNIEVISEKPTELTSILGAPIIVENKQVKETQSGRFSVIGVVGLTSDSEEEKLCPCYLDLLDENTLDMLLLQHKGRKVANGIKGPFKQGPCKDSEDANPEQKPGKLTSMAVDPSVSQDSSKIKGPVEGTHEPGKGKATSSVDAIDSQEATNIKESVEETSAPGPAITHNKLSQFGKERTKKYEILNRADQSTPREEVDSPPTNHAELDRPSNNFRKTLLSKPTSFICHEFYDEICTALDQNHPLGNDYNLLGEHIGLKKGKVAVLSQKGNPTKSMMQTLDSQKDGTIMRFQEIMEKMDRHDVLRIIENWIKHEWNDPQRRIKWLF